MKYFVFILFMLAISCKDEVQKKSLILDKVTTINSEDYELYKVTNSKALLIIFPGGGSTSKETKEEFKILDKASENGISVLLMNFNRKLWIKDEDAEQLSKIILEAAKKYNLKTDNVYVGGMSIGGTVALTLAAYLNTTKPSISIKGVFVVDSPIDLYALYESSQKDLARKDFSKERLEEPKWIVNYFEEEFGGKDSVLVNIEKVAPITFKSYKINFKSLKTKKMRFYTEPDTLWWKENRQTDFESTNAFTLQNTTLLLNKLNWKNVTLIETKNKGYRSNGERHPHSWSIVDTDNFIQWILE